MKNKIFKTSALFMAGALTLSSCVGTFSLTHKLAAWNTRATNEKFLNEIIFLFISPAYVVTGVVDALVINSMEFWSGSNPLAKNSGKTQTIMGQDGRYYAVKTLKDGYEIKKPDGEIMKFLYDNDTDSWSQVVDGKTTEIFRFNDDGSIQATLPEGGTIRVTPDAAGLFQARMAVGGAAYWAMR
ncbi:MAG: DUF3332 domain-containing protein [Prevotella sp.]